MIRKLMLFLLAVIVLPLVALEASPVEFTKTAAVRSASGGDLDISIRLVGGEGSVFRPGRDINLTFQTNKDAFVVIYNIDSEGYVHLLFPADGKLEKVKGRKVYFLPPQGSGIYWEAGDKTGIEYIHALAVEDEDRIDPNEIHFLAQNRHLPEEKMFRVDMDPYLAFNMIDEGIVDKAESFPPATDFTHFYINRQVDYPRYLCSRCHGNDKISDPYAMECPEIIIEKNSYQDDLEYPYPALFQVSHVDGDTDDDYYSSTYYADNLTDDWEDDDWADDTQVYLSLYTTNYDYPYYYHYPFHRSWFVGYYSPWWWSYDPWYWDFGWGWPNYYHGGYWSYGYWGPRHHHGYYAWHHPDRDYFRRHRSLYARRNYGTRNLSYASATTKIHRDRVIANSQLAKQRIRDSANRSYQNSRLVKRNYPSSVSGAAAGARRPVRINPSTQTKSRGREVIYGGENRTRQIREADKIRTPSTPSRSNENRNRRTIQEQKTDRNSSSGTKTRSGTSVKKRTGTTRRTQPAAKTSRSKNSQDSPDKPKTPPQKKRSSGGTKARRSSSSSGSSGSGSKSSSRSSNSSSRSKSRGSVSRSSASRSAPARTSGSNSTSRSRSSSGSSRGKKP
ncbi:MAG: DUF4384 domain-containing protein [Candidatus Krumholzibacteriota bacterium]|nr:DUF4384 domain-containing protein [Candidatus Krumholzibacteriota bacterium]